MTSLPLMTRGALVESGTLPSLPAVTQISPQRFDRGKNSMRRETQNTIVCRPRIETTPPLHGTEGIKL
ncbi:Hypothetical predicted protein [Scomber scombrus]|uniref:Uncharacterized protein n=1 Tax=Scomber scombrus TaxID=13677 RepID=A0AAV1MY99_SCOSC